MKTYTLLMAAALSLSVSVNAQEALVGASYVDLKDSLTSSTLNKESQEVVIEAPGATFIKVHFSRFKVPEGMAVVVSNKEGSEQYHYGPFLNTPYTQDKDIGDDGVDRFFSMSVSSDVVTVRLVGKATQPEELAEVVIDQYVKGLPESQWQQRGLAQRSLAQTRSICGVDNKRPAACYADVEFEAYKRSKPVVRLITGGSFCTAWRVGSGNMFLTNNHCISTQAQASASEIQFNYQQESCDGERAPSTKLAVDRLLDTSQQYDYSLFSVSGLAQAEEYGYLGLDPRSPMEGEAIYIPQHPGGRQKEMAVQADSGAYCQVESIHLSEVDMGYQCDTEGGSSGSPVFSRSTNKVIALHHLGGCNSRGNGGVRMDLIWPRISRFFDGQVPQDSFRVDDSENKRQRQTFLSAARN